METQPDQLFILLREVIISITTLVTLVITTWSAIRLAEIRKSTEQLEIRTDRRKHQREPHPDRRESDTEP